MITYIFAFPVESYQYFSEVISCLMQDIKSIYRERTQVLLHHHMKHSGRQHGNTSGPAEPDTFEDVCQVTPDGIIITIEVSAGSKKSQFPDGYNPWRKAFGVAVKAPPIEGKANKAIIELVADRFNIPKRDVTILSGQTASVKKLLITGISRQQIVDLVKEQ